MADNAESAPLLGGQTPPDPRSQRAIEVAKQHRAKSAGTMALLTVGMGIACLCIYYLNGGDSAACSTKLPLFLKVMGFASLPALLIAPLGVMKPNLVVQILGGLMGCLSCFTCVWFIVGIVWFAQTSATDCEPGLYYGYRTYLILAFVLPCVVMCCFGGLFSLGYAKAQKKDDPPAQGPPQPAP
jgi:hypothetical protein